MLDLTADELQAEIDRQLTALGVVRTESHDDAVHRMLVEGWKATGHCPKQCEMARILGVPETSLMNVLRRLAKAGRVLRQARGVWVPVVVR